MTQEEHLILKHMGTDHIFSVEQYDVGNQPQRHVCPPLEGAILGIE
jgi:hypothetical protein